MRIRKQYARPGHDQPLSYEWYFDGFDDGNPDSTDQDPLNDYSEGIYSVLLKVTDADGSPDTIIITDYIDVCYPPVNIMGDSTPYSLLQNAYDAAQDNDTIQSRDLIFTEYLSINRAINITMEGGYDCHHTPSRGTTTIEGAINISDGTVETENIVIAK